MRYLQTALLLTAIFYAVFATAKPVTSPRIIGGSAVAEGSYPWIVNLQEDGDFICGGSLIADHWVLTAAHCVTHASAEHYTLRLGVRDLSKSDQGEMRIVDKIIVHPDFSYDTLQNDVALLRFSKSISISPVTLMNTSAFNDLQTGQALLVAGWGSADTAGNIYPSILQRAAVPLINHAQCIAEYADVDVNITDKMVCAGGETTDSCFGDSGSPLFQETDAGDIQQVGVVSFGASETCADGFPGIYSRVDAYADFLISTMRDNTIAVRSGGALTGVSFLVLLAFYLFLQARGLGFVRRKIV